MPRFLCIPAIAFPRLPRPCLYPSLVLMPASLLHPIGAFHRPHAPDLTSTPLHPKFLHHKWLHHNAFNCNSATRLLLLGILHPSRCTAQSAPAVRGGGAYICPSGWQLDRWLHPTHITDVIHSTGISQMQSTKNRTEQQLWWCCLMGPWPATPRLTAGCSAGNAGRLLLRGGAQKAATVPQHGVVWPNHCLPRRAAQPLPVSEQCSLTLVSRRLCSGRLRKLALACHTPAGDAQQGSRPNGYWSQQQGAIPCPLLRHACPLQATARQCESGCRPTPLACKDTAGSRVCSGRHSSRGGNNSNSKTGGMRLSCSPSRC